MTSLSSPSPHHLALSPPPTTATTTEWKSHSVNRTAELLSCARTALKIGQAKLRQRLDGDDHGTSSSKGGHDDDPIPEWLLDVDPASLTLYNSSSRSRTTDLYGARQPSHEDDDGDDEPSQGLLRDSTALLALLDAQLSELHSLVRKRGHTNDPTLEIQATLEKFHEGVKEMKEVCASLSQEGNVPISTDRGKRVSLQRRKHYELISSHLESLTKERMDLLKKELEMRSVVIRDQMSHRKKLLSVGTAATATGAGSGATSTANVRRMNVPLQSNLSTASTSAQFQSPLFTMTSSGNGPNLRNAKYKTSVSAPTSSNRNGSAVENQSASSGYYAGYGGYGGAAANTIAPSFSTGMRQRKQPSTYTQLTSQTQIDQGDNDDDKYTKDNTLQQIQTRRQNRQTASRLQSARLAEKSIAELTTMFAKMSTLISQQGEVLERIEDDVEAAGGDIDAGHEELVKVYGYTKGNRGLILKVFGVLIFLIFFMKFYKK